MKRQLLIALAIFTCGTLALRADDAKDLYQNQCAKCHGVDGKGETKMGKRLGAKDYSNPTVQDQLTDDAAFKAIKQGLTKDDKTLMKPAEGLSDDQIKGLVAYMRAFKK